MCLKKQKQEVFEHCSLIYMSAGAVSVWQGHFLWDFTNHSFKQQSQWPFSEHPLTVNLKGRTSACHCLCAQFLQQIGDATWLKCLFGLLTVVPLRCVCIVETRDVAAKVCFIMLNKRSREDAPIQKCSQKCLYCSYFQWRICRVWVTVK